MRAANVKARAIDRLALAHRRVVLGGLQPSLVRFIASDARIKNETAKHHSRDPREFWDRQLKDKIEDIARRAEVLTPKVLRHYSEAAEANFGELPDIFVWKPTWGSGAKGVKLLVRNNETFSERLSRRILNQDDIIREHEELWSGGKCSKEVKIEQAIGHGEVPDDWKAFAFRGEVPLVLQVSGRGNRRQYRHYDSSFAPIKRPCINKADSPLSPPYNPEAILEAARRISMQVSLPFVRVDMYEGRDGVYLGEITPIPGGQFWRKCWDHRLGQYYESAQANLRLQCNYYSASLEQTNTEGKSKS